MADRTAYSAAALVVGYRRRRTLAAGGQERINVEIAHARKLATIKDEPRQLQVISAQSTTDEKILARDKGVILAQAKDLFDASPRAISRAQACAALRRRRPGAGAGLAQDVEVEAAAGDTASWRSPACRR